MSDAFALRPIQVKAIEMMRASVKSGKKRPQLQLATGSGKTVIAGHMVKNAREKKKRVAFTVPLLSLVDQTMERFEAIGIDRDEIGVQQGDHEWFRPHAPVQICSVQTLVKRDFPATDLIIVDECFAAGTMVSTPSGDRPIESVQSGDIVFNAAGIGVVEATSRKLRRTVDVHLSSGEEIRVTPNHKFFTDRGWIAAGALERGERVFGREDVSLLWRGFSPQGRGGVLLEASQILLHSLRSGENPQSDARSGYQGQGFRYAASDGAWSEAARRKRQADACATGETLGGAGGRLALGVRGDDWMGEETGADALQDRHREGRWASSYRGRRPVASVPRRTGPEEGCVPDGVRVVRVSRDERRGLEAVFDLRVSGHPSYFAGGVLVHNSHLQFKRIYEWMDQKPEQIFVGLSATPWAQGMGQFYDDLLVPATIKDMIADGSLCKFKTFAPIKPDLSGVEVGSDGDYVQKQLAEVMGRPKIVGDVVEHWLEHAQDRPTMLFAVNCAHAALLHDRLCKYDVKSAYVDARTTREERLTIKTLFERGEIKVICSVGTMNAGVDLPSVSCIALARPTKSPIFYVQAIGRGLRPHPDKSHLLILDHTKSTFELGLVDEIGFKSLNDDELKRASASQRETKLASPRECPDCGVIVPALERRCACGHEFRHWANVDHVEGELYEIGGDTPEEQRTRREQMRGPDKQLFYRMLLHYARAHGYKDGWAFMKYRQRMGDMTKPPWGWHGLDPVPPSNLVLAWIVRVNNQFRRQAS